MKLTKKEIQAEIEFDRAKAIYSKALKVFDEKTAQIKKALENYFKGAVISDIRLPNEIWEQWVVCRVKYPPAVKNKRSGYYEVSTSCLRRVLP